MKYPSRTGVREEDRLHIILSESLEKRIDRSTRASSTVKPKEASENSRRFGGLESYHTSSHTPIVIDRLCSVRGYKILTFSENERGCRTVFDLLTGTIYQTGVGLHAKITRNAVLFDSTTAAMSERFPSKMVGFKMMYLFLLLCYLFFACRLQVGVSPRECLAYCANSVRLVDD